MKKTPTTTALAMPEMPAIQPKPTKTEIVDAIVARAKVKHDAENERRSKLRDALEKKITAIAIKAVKSLVPYVSIYTYNDSRSNHCDVKFNCVTTPELAPLLEQYESLGRIHWDEKETRQAIRRELSGISKPSPTRLLDNPETVKAIDAMLSQWGLG